MRAAGIMQRKKQIFRQESGPAPRNILFGISGTEAAE
jgi:hypothetical protein